MEGGFLLAEGTLIRFPCPQIAGAVRSCLVHKFLSPMTCTACLIRLLPFQWYTGLLKS
jgi:hypothetical protein